METRSDVRETGSTLGTGLDEARGFFEEFGIHVLLEITLVGIVDSFLKNTVLSMLVGVCIVEGCQVELRILSIHHRDLFRPFIRFTGVHRSS
jgi:hypothetical protein